MHYLSAQATFNVLLTSLDALMRGAEETQEFRVELDKNRINETGRVPKDPVKSAGNPGAFFCPIVSAGVDGAQHAFCSRYTTGLISYEYRSIRSAVWCE